MPILSEAALELLAKTQASGPEFFAVAVEALSIALDCPWAGIGLLQPDNERIKVLAFWDHGQLAASFEFNLHGAPCEAVYQSLQPHTHIYFPDEVAAQFPEDRMLAQKGVRCYRGELFCDSEGQAAGHVFTLNDSAEWDRPEARTFFRLVSQRVGAEYNRWRSEQALRDAQARYQALVETQTDLICRAKPDATLTYVNQACADFFGKTPDQLIGSNFKKWLLRTDIKLIQSSLQTLRPAHPVVVNEGRIINAQGQARWFHWISHGFFDEHEQLVEVQTVARDIDARKQAETALYLEKERAQITLRCIGDAVVTTDPNGRIEFLNPIAEQLTGWTLADARGQPVRAVLRLLDSHDRKNLHDPVARCLTRGEQIELSGDIVLLNRHGREYAIEDSAAPIRGPNDALLGVVMVFRDVTETRRMRRQLSYDASHDDLTGLVNRREFEKRLQHALNSAKQHSARHVLCYLDLDQLKIVNDTAGHAAGDQLLKDMNQVLRHLFRERDTFARLGGDEFGLLLDNCPLSRGVKIAENILSCLRDYRFIWTQHSFQISASIGVTEITAEASTINDILRQADGACYTAKDLGRNRVYRYQTDDEELTRRHSEIRLVTKLRNALEQDRLCLYYQPLIHLQDARKHTCQIELLLRLPDDNGALIAPEVFIPAAERYGLMADIDRWVIRTAFEWAAQYDAAPDAHIAINLSGSSINDEHFLDFVTEQFARTGLSAQRVCFQITETVAIHNLNRASELINELRRQGVRMALDDFGSGLSSFRYLKALPVDYLKIDGDFIGGLLDNTVDEALVCAAVQVAHALSIQTIAKHVDNPKLIEPLLRLGVDCAQGYALGRPQPWINCDAEPITALS